MKLPDVTNASGSPMGRQDVVTDPDYPVKFKLYRMILDRGGYDKGGAYWGVSKKQMFHAYGDGKEEVQQLFIRAKDREEAKIKIRKHFPNARFYH